jgi:hypothetical protein
MQHKKFILGAILLVIIGLSGIQAQETIPASGGEASGSGGSASYSVGQVVYTTNLGTSGSVAQGVQQPYEISIVSGLEEMGINLYLSVYPNPATDFLQLTIENEDMKEFSYQLYDINGKLLENKKITGNETSIAFSNFIPATYFLKVIEGKNEVRTFKIVKN